MTDHTPGHHPTTPVTGGHDTSGDSPSTRTPPGHDADDVISRSITRAIDDTEATVPWRSPDDLLDAARTARDAGSHRRRRNVRIVVGTAAALVLTIAGAAIALTRQSDDRTSVASQSFAYDPNTESRSVIRVVPSIDLTDGQQVTVTALHGAFDPGTPVSALQCRWSNTVSMHECDTRTATSLGPMPTDGGDLSAPTNVLAELAALAPYRFDAATGSWAPDPLAGASVPLSCVTGAGGERTVGSAVGDANGVAEDPTADGSTEPATPLDREEKTEQAEPGSSGVPPTTMADDDPGSGAPPCMIDVTGVSEGQPRVLSYPIWFADSSATPVGPGSSGTGTADATTPSQAESSTTISSTVHLTDCPSEAEWLTFTGDTGSSGPLVDTTPHGILVCTYRYSGGVASSVGGRLITDPARIATIVHALNRLQVPDPDQGCTADAGTPIALVLDPGDHGQLVWVEGFGCGYAHSDGRVRDGARSVPSLLG